MKRCLIKAHRRKRFRAKSGKKGSRGKKLARLDPAMQLGAHLQLHPVCTVHLWCTLCTLHPVSPSLPVFSSNVVQFLVILRVIGVVIVVVVLLYSSGVTFPFGKQDSFTLFQNVHSRDMVIKLIISMQLEVE